METKFLPSQLKVETNLKSNEYDGIVLVSGAAPGTEEPEPFKSVIYCASEIDDSLFDNGAVLPINLPAKRLIYSPTGRIDPDYGDVRFYGEAATKGMERALKAGVRNPLLVLLPDPRFENAELVTLLGALEALYVALQVRDMGPESEFKAKKLGVWSPICSKKLQGLVKLASAIESGRFVARDLGGTDPERMAAPVFERYVTQVFAGTRINVQVISNPETLLREYPLFAAVNRGASLVPRHAGRVIFMTYEPQDPTRIQETVMIVGKGVTYDTGGNNIKIHFSMTGMSRDKCGAASAVGFMQTVNLLQPPTVKVVVAVGVVRNSCGSNAYVADEVITARSGARVRMNNTDAEGRLVLADILYHIKEMAQNEVNPSILSIATLTGHAERSFGEYTVAMDNSVARAVSNASKLQAYGESVGDMFEVSVLRRDDFKKHKGRGEGDDLVQADPDATSSGSQKRGHQGPAAFLIGASGIHKHGLFDQKPLKYCHLDIAGSESAWPKQPYGKPIVALARRFLEKEFKENLAENRDPKSPEN